MVSVNFFVGIIPNHLELRSKVCFSIQRTGQDFDILSKQIDQFAQSQSEQPAGQDMRQLSMQGS